MTNITKILFIFHIEIYSDSKQQHQFTKQPLKGVISYGNNRERKKKYPSNPQTCRVSTWILSDPMTYVAVTQLYNLKPVTEKYRYPHSQSTCLP
jgi:hypothetical protein